MDKINVQYGCGLSAPDNWKNFDASPTLRLQKNPITKLLFKRKLNVIFPENVKYGDIVKGLPFEENSCDNIYCSHILEHLSYNDCIKALSNTYKMLKVGGIFRCIVPDLEIYARNYILKFDRGTVDSGDYFIRQTMLGQEVRTRGIKNILLASFGNSHHLWMWDEMTLRERLIESGFKNIRRCKFNDSGELSFREVEDDGRFIEALAFECIK